MKRRFNTTNEYNIHKHDTCEVLEKWFIPDISFIIYGYMKDYKKEIEIMIEHIEKEEKKRRRKNKDIIIDNKFLLLEVLLTIELHQDVR